MKLKTFVVEGAGQFPYDMLRYDACWPATENDSRLLEGTLRERRRVAIETIASFTLTPDRWASFGWKIVGARS
jgi:hypothetical protein